MASGSATKREELFSLYAKNLSIYFPRVSEVFLCPVCRVPFDRGALTSRPPKVALAHIVPRALGGRLCTLVCRACDNRVGSAYDSHAEREKRFHDWQDGRRPIAARLTHEGRDIPVEVDKGTGGRPWSFRFARGRSDPASVARFFGAAEASWSNLKFSLKVRVCHPVKRDRSILFSAFLMMFYEFGYEWVLSRDASPIRRALSDEAEFARVRNAMFPLPTGLPGASPVPCVGVLVDPPAFRSFIVALPSPLPNEAARCVLLPGFEQQGHEAYERILALAQPLGDFRVAVPVDDPMHRMARAECKGFAVWVWRTAA